jgi:hypothetical protein
MYICLLPRRDELAAIPQGVRRAISPRLTNALPARLSFSYGAMTKSYGMDRLSARSGSTPPGRQKIDYSASTGGVIIAAD